MSSAIYSEFQATIAKHLPQAVGEGLRAELEILEAFRAAEPVQKSTEASLRREIAVLQERNSALQLQVKREADLVAREAAVKLKEDSIKFVEFRAMVADQRHAEMLGLVGMVFKSPMFRTVQSGSVPVPVEGMPGDPSRGTYAIGGSVQTGSVNLATDTSVG